MTESSSAARRPKRDWRKPIQLQNSGDAETWAYLSKSGRTLKVYVRPIDSIGECILSSPISVTIRLSTLRK